MKDSVFKIIAIAAICVFAAVCVFIGADIFKSRQISLNQSQSALNYMSQNCAYEFQAIFDNGELLVDNMAAIVEQTIVVSDSADMNKNIEYCRAFIMMLAADSKYPISLYVTFNPEYFKGDIWHIQTLDGEVYDASLNTELMEEWLKEWRKKNSEWTDFYWDTVRNQEMWFETKYDSETKWYVVSKTRAVYDKNNVLIGIVGADIYLGDISAKLESVDQKTGGVSAVVNSDGQLIAGDGGYIEKISDKKYINATADMGNLWTVIITQPIKEAVGSAYDMALLTMILGAVVLIALFGIIFFVYMKHGRTIITKFEEKDLLMINQARQAQMGEMVGNIAHQLKQPLNGVNMALTNLREEYADSVEDVADFESRIIRMKSRIANMSETVDDFMVFLKPQREAKVFSVEKATEDVISLMEERLSIYSIGINLTGSDFHIEGYKNEFGQCIFNILDNAIHELKKRDSDRIISIDLYDDGTNGHVMIENTGSKIEEALIENVFDLYFTTKEKEGSGIGLYLTKMIVEMHFSGSIICRNTDRGVCFEMIIPLKESEEEGK